MSIAGRFVRWIARFLAIAGAAIVAHHPGAMAHEARPAYLELTETLPDRYDVVWRTPVSAGQRLPVVLQLPDGVSTVVEPRLREFADSVVERRIIAVPGGLGGKRIEFVGLQATITDVLVRVQTRDGARSTTLVHPSRPWLEIAPARGSFAVAGAYLAHGIEHILLGYDHLLFVLALILIVRNLRVLIATVTAFTVAHSITLALATLGVVHVPGPPVEAAIALSILLLASRDRAHKRRTTEPHGEVALVGGVLVRASPRLRFCECAFRDWTAARRHSTRAIHVQSRCRDRTTRLHCRRAGVARRRATNSDTAQRDATGSAGCDLRDRHTGRVLVRRARRRICVMRRCAPRQWPRVASLLGSCFLGLLTATSFGQQVDVAGSIAAENASLAAQLRADQAAFDRWSAELENLRNAKRELDERLQWIERRAAVYPLGQELAQALNEQLRKLPRQERFAVANAQRTEVLAEASDADLRVERALRELADLDAATAQRLSDVLPAPSQEQQQRVRAALAEQRELLQRLAELDRKQLDVLHEVDVAWHDLDSASQAARAKLTRFLFWIPAPPSTRTAGQFAPALAWLVSPANWRAAGEVVRHEFTRAPFWPSVALVAAAALLALRRRLLHKLASITPSTVTYERYRIGHAIAALAITFALAAPVPLVLWTAGAMLVHASDSQSLALALGDAFLADVEATARNFHACMASGPARRGRTTLRLG